MSVVGPEQGHIPGLEPEELPVPEQLRPENILATLAMLGAGLAFASEFVHELIGYPRQSQETRLKILEEVRALNQPLLDELNARIAELEAQTEAAKDQKWRIEELLLGLANAARTPDPVWLPEIVGYKQPIDSRFESRYYQNKVQA